VPEPRIVTLDLDGVRTALAWAAAEGWNPGRADAEPFLAADPDGFLAVTVDGRIAVTASVVRWSDTFAFGGLFIADPEHRRAGLGNLLLEAALAAAGDRTVGLDAVLEQEPRYARLGFAPAYTTTRWTLPDGVVVPPPEAETVEARELAFDALVEYDARCVAAARPAFLAAWLAVPGADARVVVSHGGIVGWGMRRPCAEGAKIGPLFADDPDVAELLWRALTHGRPGPVQIDAPDPNASAQEIVRRHGLVPGFTTRRMYLGPPPEFDLGRVVGVTTLELG